MSYEWDENKARRNITKHDVTFEEAATVFDDPLYIDFFAPCYSDDEERYILLGRSNRYRILIVSYTERSSNTRIISARLATRSEQYSEPK